MAVVESGLRCVYMDCIWGGVWRDIDAWDVRSLVDDKLGYIRQRLIDS